MFNSNNYEHVRNFNFVFYIKTDFLNAGQYNQHYPKQVNL